MLVLGQLRLKLLFMNRVGEFGTDCIGFHLKEEIMEQLNRKAPSDTRRHFPMAEQDD
ncbi:hypothetical protein GJ744_010840 [Endocarpon pusillum]|uniref:Uncharacterized protein n=1 Tax=Endocarpon pusillum TaxID=364733 RepID=A0A8H7ADZ7_9EURO|nr:hypothetical protein GJ744_010840 [Endocarpon pusillum]